MNLEQSPSIKQVLDPLQIQLPSLPVSSYSVGFCVDKQFHFCIVINFMCLYETVCKAHKSVLTGKHWCIYLDVEYSSISVCCLYEGCDVFSAWKIFPLFLLNMHIYSYKLWLPATLLHIFNCKNIYPRYSYICLKTYPKF